jgi:hypothetical protein
LFPAAAFVGAGTFNWRELAQQTHTESFSGLGESPYFPTLRGPRRQAMGDTGAEFGVTNSAFAASVKADTLDVNKGEGLGLSLLAFDAADFGK